MKVGTSEHLIPWAPQDCSGTFSGSDHRQALVGEQLRAAFMRNEISP